MIYYSWADQACLEMALEKAKRGMIGDDSRQQNYLYYTISNISSTGIQLEKSLS
jgi:hypothetical protein